VQFTPEITKLGQDLENNPVRIYNWVRNNIRFVPIWGSIQGASHCLETRVCNTFDTASLLIALLRVSGIPARYQMGTIEVPIEPFLNWAGGFTDPDAAASLFASGGVPSVVERIDDSGQVVTITLEHVWVKAFVDYIPSGGALHSQGDTWVALDPSFKQYKYTERVDLETVVPSNVQDFAEQLLTNATIDPETDSVTNIDSAAIESFVHQFLDDRLDYIKTNLPDASVDEITGAQVIAGHAPPLSPATTPYRVLAFGLELADIPAGLRHKVTFDLGVPPTVADLTEFIYTAILPEIAGQSVLLLYTPASDADEQLLISSVSQFKPWPSSIRLRPQLYVGHQLVAQGNPLPVGSHVVFGITFAAPTLSTPVISNTTLVGESSAIGLDLNGIAPAQLEVLRQKAKSIGNLLQQENFDELTGRDFAEGILASNIVTWFALVDQMNELSSRAAGVVTIRYPSAGRFFSQLRVTSLFAIPISVSSQGLSMDVDRDIVISLAKDGDLAKSAALTFGQGAFGSALEAEVPITMLSSTNNPVNGVATPHALRQANDQGTPIHKINASNASAILPLLRIDQSDLTDIQDAINAGLEVIVPETPVTSNSRNVLGIVIQDPLTGSASFVISGGINGAQVEPEVVEEIKAIIPVLFLAVGGLAFISGILAGVVAIVLGFILSVTVFLAFVVAEIFGFSFCDAMGAFLSIYASIPFSIANFGFAAFLFIGLAVWAVWALSCRELTRE